MLCSAGLGAGGWGSECVECLGTRPRTAARHGCVSAGAPVLRGRAPVPRRAHACTWRLRSPSRARAAPQQDDTGGFNVWGAEELRAVLLWGLVLSEPALTEVPCELPQAPRDPQAGGQCGSQPGRSVPGTPCPPPPPQAASPLPPPVAGRSGLRRPPWVSVIAPRLHVACVLWILVCDLDFPPARFFSIPNREAEPGIVFAGSGQGEVTSCGVRGPGRGRGSAVACALS